jgi:hypothetical protein
VRVWLTLPLQDLAQCAQFSINGGALQPAVVQGGAVVMQAELVAVAGVSMLTWGTVGQ